MHLASTTFTFASTTAFIAHPPVDWVILFFFALIVMIDALRNGTARAATLSVVFPLTFFFFGILSHAAIFGQVIEKVSAPLTHAAVFGVLFAVLFFLVYRIMYALGSSGSMPFASAVATLASTIITLVVWLQVPALQSVWHFGPQIQAVFGIAYAFWWLIAAYLLMAFIRS